ncbi:TonB-dependent receptor [Pseudobacteriovorax antillogorgiicola]|uniref:Outer membrane receptor proteins, mostly Fe transport n=1 Tax=Pseudobacteriovorax antillogorgiicola TaxID=1513793 RepID=A0A1Y6BB76_9BACT|nr:TonB-dependent receptor plug domain-containing protein [Pseudobacteriovorax antillogorgiicola]TCS57332.1 outer membrane receptor protein involved in Fe transport [Pseudobacteriovorax antillogorgiicola]SMF02397.1 Outer membrane receptor proteins, mostly Fe transport [Pseudobacteriovorax antillogorgiicola]
MYQQRLLLILSVPLSASTLSYGQSSEIEPPPTGEERLETMEIKGSRTNRIGESITAGEGEVGQAEISQRPLSRTGEIIEFVPGFIATQHSGSGKANQYFGRGFNLDHGTDFRMSIDGMPINMRSHGHGQGYSDANFIIPEVIESLEYRKGPYYADSGDFSSAGYAKLSTFDRLGHGEALIGGGSYGYGRTLIMDSIGDHQRSFTYAFEAQQYDGPWQGIDENVEKLNGFAKQNFSWGRDHLSISLMAYDNRWNSAEQVPSRAVEAGLINRLAVIDDKVGGETKRNSLAMQWQRQLDQARISFNAYAIDYDLKLINNFTYFIDEANGDQFSQVDSRRVFGANGEWQQNLQIAGVPIQQRFGIEGQVDTDLETGLYRTQEQDIIETQSEHEAQISNLSLYSSTELGLSTDLRSNISYRVDSYDYQVRNLVNQKSASDRVTMGSLKGSFAYRVGEGLESYLAIGQGFHSNDFKGVLATEISDDPEAEDADPIVRSLGYETGLAWSPSSRINLSVGIWQLESDSELIYVGDEGSTEASRASVRRGIEWTTYYRPNTNWTYDLEIAQSDARYSSDPDNEGREVEGHIPLVVSGGVYGNMSNGLLAGLRLRYLGERPLTADGSQRSSATSLVNLRTGYQWGQFRITLDVFNIFDSKDNDIEYYYASRLPGEVEPQDDRHFHPVEPRSVRTHLSYMF